MILGVQDDRVALRSYTPLWRWLFLFERQRLWFCLRPHTLDIQHVGSTAIPGMPAKPIIDILVVVEDFEEATPCIHRIESIGYKYQGENDQLRQYRFIKGQRHTHSLYIVESESKELVAKACFRDYLTQHPETAGEYADLKQRLAGQYPTDRAAYQKGKGEFIRQILHTVGSGDSL